jgi:hypothetical protein
VSVGEREVEFDLYGAFGEPFLLAALAKGGQVRAFAMEVEGSVVLVLLVEEEEVGVLLERCGR